MLKQKINYMGDIVTYENAVSQKLRRYATGIPCVNGHVDERCTRNKSCCVCCSDNERKWKSKHPDSVRKYHAKQESRPERKKYRALWMRKWTMDNRELANERRRIARRDNEAIADRHRGRSRRYVIANRDRVLARQSAYRGKKENRDKAALAARKWYCENKDRAKSWYREYANKNPDLLRVHKQNRRARFRNAEGSFSAVDIARIRKLQKNKCGVCKNPLVDMPRMVHIDHIAPLSKGGSNWPRNLQLLCPPCNLHKHARDPIDHMRSLGFLL